MVLAGQPSSYPVSVPPSEPHSTSWSQTTVINCSQMVPHSSGYSTYKCKWETLKILDLSFSEWEGRKGFTSLYPQRKGSWHKGLLFEARVLGKQDYACLYSNCGKKRLDGDTAEGWHQRRGQKGDGQRVFLLGSWRAVHVTVTEDWICSEDTDEDRQPCAPNKWLQTLWHWRSITRHFLASNRHNSANQIIGCIKIFL